MMRLIEKLFDMVSEGLSNFGPQVGAEVSRLGTQRAMEAASGLLHGSGFVPYGPGQYTPTPEATGPEQGTAAMAMDHEQEHGREM
jgi:hypothetical protein